MNEALIAKETKVNSSIKNKENKEDKFDFDDILIEPSKTTSNQSIKGWSRFCRKWGFRPFKAILEPKFLKPLGLTRG